MASIWHYILTNFLVTAVLIYFNGLGLLSLPLYSVAVWISHFGISFELVRDRMFDFQLGISYFFFVARYRDFILNRFQDCLSQNFSLGKINFSRCRLVEIQKPEIQCSWWGGVFLRPTVHVLKILKWQLGQRYTLQVTGHTSQ